MCSIDKYVDLRGGYKNVLFGEGVGEGRGGPKLPPDQRTTPSSSLKATRGKQKENAGGGANKQRR